MTEVIPGSTGVYPESAELRASGGIAKMTVDADGRLVDDAALYLGYAVDTALASEASFELTIDTNTAKTAFVDFQVFSDQPMTIAVKKFALGTASTDTYSLVNLNRGSTATAGTTLLGAATTDASTTNYVSTAVFSLTVPQAQGEWCVADINKNARWAFGANTLHALTITNGGTAAGYVSIGLTVQEK